jgi:hypothetical protein
VLGDGRLAVSGADYDDTAGRLPRRFGLWVVDTATWTWRRAEAGVDWVLPVAGGGAVTFDSRGGGVVRFAPDGRRMWRRTFGRGVDAQTHGAVVVVRDRRRHRTLVLDANTGATRATLSRTPPIIVPDR